MRPTLPNSRAVVTIEVGLLLEMVGGGIGGFSSNCCCIKSFCFSDYPFTSKLAPVS